jgi:hypothetical protein
MLVTRDIINPNIEFVDIKFRNFSYTYQQLCNGIDVIKDILLNKYGCQPGDSILIGINTSALQIATFFACAELGLQVVVLDHGRNDNWIATDYIDPKTQSLMPIRYFIVDDRYTNLNSPKYEFFKKVCPNFVILDAYLLDNQHIVPQTKVYATPESILIKCTSSGTTGTAKIVQHTHQFLSKLIPRNGCFYDDTVCMITNLNHGSSPATYFLPALCSDNTKKFVSFVNIDNDDGVKHPIKKFKDVKFNFSRLSIAVQNHDIKHLMLPYTHMIQDFFDQNDHPNLTLYTLSTIPIAWLDVYKNKKIKNIISFFGCNETSGPVFISEINDTNFAESNYKLMDDFYKINLNDGTNLEVEMPVYDKKICTNDMFEHMNGYYRHIGRNDLYRVNGHVVDLQKYKDTVMEFLNATLIVDTIKDKLYVAVWDQVDDVENRVKDISQEFQRISESTHKVDKFAVLEQNKFYSGVKLDMELLRDYFRKFV